MPIMHGMNNIHYYTDKINEIQSRQNIVKKNID